MLQIRTEIKSFLPRLDSCIAQEQEELKILNAELNLLKKVSVNDYALTEKKQLLLLVKKHQDKMSFCEFLVIKIHHLEKKIAKFNSKNYKNNLFEKDASIVTALKEYPQKIQKHSPRNYALNNYALLTRAKANIRIISLGFFLIFACKILNFFNWRFRHFTKDISLIQYFKTLMILSILVPFQYIILKITFSPYNEILIDFFQRIVYSGMIVCFVIYTYRNIKTKYFFKDNLLILGHIFIFYLAVFLVFELHYLELNNFPQAEILIKKYLLLILLQPLLFSVGYWSLKKVIHLKIFHHWSLKILCLFSTLIFLIGLMGYVNFAINTILVIIIDTISILWLLIFTKLKNSILNQINDPQSHFSQFLEKYMANQKNKTIINLKMIVIVMYIFFIFYMCISIITLSIWLLPETFLTDLYEILNHQIRSENYSFNFKLINLIQVYVMTLILNISNFYISNAMARKLFEDKMTQEKTAHLFNWLGYMITALIMLQFLGFQLKNLIIIFGGLSIGIGFGLNNLITNLVSSFILFFNCPFKIGDYIEIDQTKGIVKKISLLETSIETSDNNTLIIPNQIAASSIIHNYTYGNKSFQKIHIKYIINNLNFQDEETIKTGIIQLLKQVPHLLENKSHAIQCTFALLENTKDACRLEIVFCLTHNLNLKTQLAKINRDIYKLLKSMKLDVHYEDMQFPSI